jgi:hypothetical protein
MDTPMSTFDKLKQLVESFHRDVALAKELESCTPQDDLAIKLAIVGFSYNSSTQDWDKSHFDFVKSRLECDYPDEELTEYGENGRNVKLFFALGIGLLLGMYQQGKVDDEEFDIAAFQIPGLIMFYLPRLTDRPV